MRQVIYIIEGEQGELNALTAEEISKLAAGDTVGDCAWEGWGLNNNKVWKVTLPKKPTGRIERSNWELVKR